MDYCVNANEKVSVKWIRFYFRSGLCQLNECQWAEHCGHNSHELEVEKRVKTCSFSDVSLNSNTIPINKIKCVLRNLVDVFFCFGWLVGWLLLLFLLQYLEESICSEVIIWHCRNSCDSIGVRPSVLRFVFVCLWSFMIWIQGDNVFFVFVLMTNQNQMT